MKGYEFLPEAEEEMNEAARFYERRKKGLGFEFLSEVERTIALVREYPDAGSAVGPKRRRVLVARFPYSIVYRQDPDAIGIVAVAHQRRRPGYWRRRS